ncbi:MAG: undecaprenyl-diphosphate phosphatase [Candidatus Heimdallarchaeota archaeon]
MVALWIIIILAVAQGILEWLPVSSEGQLYLILTWLGENESVLDIALFMHLGTMLAVIVKFRKDFLLLFNFKLWKKNKEPESESVEENTSEENTEASEEPIENDIEKAKEQKFLWKFILIATAATAVIGLPLYFLLKFVLGDGEFLEFANGAMNSGDIITIIIGVFLIATGIFIIVARKKRTEKPLMEMTTKEIIILGSLQGLTIIPGVSRSGTTVSTMLVEGIKEEETLRGSFLLSVPAILGINILTIIINLIQGEPIFGVNIPWYGILLAIVISGVIGYLTIDFFLWAAKKINFGWFCISFGILAVIITIIIVILNVTTIA